MVLALLFMITTIWRAATDRRRRRRIRGNGGRDGRIEKRANVLWPAALVPPIGRGRPNDVAGDDRTDNSVTCLPATPSSRARRSRVVGGGGGGGGVIRVRGLRASSRQKFSFAASAALRSERRFAGGAATDEVRAPLRRMRRAKSERAPRRRRNDRLVRANRGDLCDGGRSERFSSPVDYRLVGGGGRRSTGERGTGAHSEGETR